MHSQEAAIVMRNLCWRHWFINEVTKHRPFAILRGICWATNGDLWGWLVHLVRVCAKAQRPEVSRSISVK